jgi:hypothetical protein
VQQRPGENEESTTVGIATSSFTDAEILYFHVHLCTGVSLTINSGFVQIIEETECDFHTSEEERENNLIDTHHEEQYGRPSSYEDLNLSSSEDDEFWLEEVLHAPTVETGGGLLGSLGEDAYFNRAEERRDANEDQCLAEAAAALL